MTFKEFKKELPQKPFRCWTFAHNMCELITPYLIYLFVRFKVRPNTITLLMIIIGVIAGLVLLLPFWWCKIIAGFLYYLWYALDETDGNVARITQTFSKGGKYLDWCAHLLTHPLFAVSMWLSLVNTYHYLFFSIVSFVLIICELLSRNLISMETLYGDTDNSPYHEYNELGIIRYIVDSCFYMPNYVIVFPFILALSILLDWNWFYIAYICWALIYSVYVLKAFMQFIWKMYKSY